MDACNNVSNNSIQQLTPPLARLAKKERKTKKKKEQNRSMTALHATLNANNLHWIAKEPFSSTLGSFLRLCGCRLRCVSSTWSSLLFLLPAVEVVACTVPFPLRLAAAATCFSCAAAVARRNFSMPGVMQPMYLCVCVVGGGRRASTQVEGRSELLKERKRERRIWPRPTKHLGYH